jgi:5-methylcytosine-specific restriction endonuclease McrA
MGMTQAQLRRKVFARDQGVCDACGLDTLKVKRVLKKLHLRAQKRQHQWKFRQMAWRIAENMAHRGFVIAKHMWEADHTVPKAIGGTDDLDNLRTLCIRCHRVETKRLAEYRARRKALKKEHFSEDWVP